MLLLLAIGACTRSEEEIIGSIYGKVTDSKNGKVLQGVTITLIPGGLSRTTGSDGTYEFLDLEAKQYQVQAQKMGYVTDTKSVNVLVGQAASGDMRLTPEKKDAEITITPSSLNFGTTQEEGVISLFFTVFHNSFELLWGIGYSTEPGRQAHTGSGGLRYAAKILYKIMLAGFLCLTKPAFMRRPWRILPVTKSVTSSNFSHF